MQDWTVKQQESFETQISRRHPRFVPALHLNISGIGHQLAEQFEQWEGEKNPEDKTSEINCGTIVSGAAAAAGTQWPCGDCAPVWPRAQSARPLLHRRLRLADGEATNTKTLWDKSPPELEYEYKAADYLEGLRRRMMRLL